MCEGQGPAQVGGGRAPDQNIISHCREPVVKWFVERMQAIGRRWQLKRVQVSVSQLGRAVSNTMWRTCKRPGLFGPVLGLGRIDNDTIFPFTVINHSEREVGILVREAGHGSTFWVRTCRLENRKSIFNILLFWEGLANQVGFNYERCECCAICCMMVSMVHFATLFWMVGFDSNWIICFWNYHANVLFPYRCSALFSYRILFSYAWRI